MSALIGADVALAEAAAKEAVEARRRRKESGLRRRQRQCAGQVVISGTQGDGRARRRNRQGQGRQARACRLPVSAPFHCPLMQPAADKMAEALAAVTIRPPAVPLIANVTAAETAEPDTIRRLLVEQVTARVRWRESVLAFRAAGVEMTVEAGGNKVLTGMVKRIDKELATVTLDTPADIEAFARTSVMFDLTGKVALVTGASGGIGGAIAKALHAQGATVVLSGTRGDALEALKTELGGRAHVAVLQSRRHGLGGSAAQDGGSRGGPHRHPGQQCRRHARQSLHAHEGRGVGPGDRGRPDRRLPPLPRGVARDDEEALGADRLDHLGGRRHGQSGPGQLRGGEGRPRRHDEIAGGRGREPQHHGQLRGAGLHRDRR